MKRFIVLMLTCALAIMSFGCADKHVNDVPEDMQKVEIAIHDAGVFLEAAPKLKTDAMSFAIEAYQQGKITYEDFSKVVTGARNVDKALITAVKTLKELRLKIDAGESVPIATVDALTVGVKEALKQMGVE